MLKIAQIVSTYPPYRGGMGAVAEQMTSQLRARGHQVAVFTPDYGLAQKNEDPNVVCVKPWFKSGNAAFVPNASRLLDGFDLVHLHYPFFGGAEAIARRRRRTPKQALVITYHMDTVGRGMTSLFFKAYRQTVMPWILQSADAVTVSSLDYAKHSALYGHLLPLQELPFGADEIFCPVPRSQPPVPQLLFVGGLDSAHYFKGLHVLLEALKFVKTPLTLRVVGSGNLMEGYQNQAKEALVSDKVQFLGPLALPELIKEYQQAWATVLPSVDQSEAFGMVLVESQACGTPVIASNLPGVRTVFEEGKTGRAVPPRDPKVLAAVIDDLFSNPSKLEEMRQACAARVNALYRWPKVIDKLEEIYFKVKHESTNAL